MACAEVELNDRLGDIPEGGDDGNVDPELTPYIRRGDKVFAGKS